MDYFIGDVAEVLGKKNNLYRLSLYISNDCVSSCISLVNVGVSSCEKSWYDHSGSCCSGASDVSGVK